MSFHDEEELEQCTRYEQKVDWETLVTLGDWRLCEICMGDI